MHKIVLAYYLLLFLTWQQCQADIFQECTEQNKGHFIPSEKGCIYFIFCDGEDSFEGDCGNDEYFNAIEEICEPMGDMDCRTGVLATRPENVPSTDNPLAITNSSESSNAVNSTQLAASTEVTFTNTVAVITARLCPNEDNANQLVFLANTRSCTDYFICYHGEALPMHCSASLHFNALTSKCDHAENVKCMVNAVSARDQCKLHTVDVYPHPSNCNYYYSCRSGYLLVQQCPFFFGWDFERRACVSLGQAKCFGSHINRFQNQLKLF